MKRSIVVLLAGSALGAWLAAVAPAAAATGPVTGVSGCLMEQTGVTGTGTASNPALETLITDKTTQATSVGVGPTESLTDVNGDTQTYQDKTIVDPYATTSLVGGYTGAAGQGFVTNDGMTNDGNNGTGDSEQAALIPGLTGFVVSGGSNLVSGYTQPATLTMCPTPVAFATADEVNTAITNINNELATQASDSGYFTANSVGLQPLASGANSVAAGQNATANNAGDVAVGLNATATGGSVSPPVGDVLAPIVSAVSIGDANTATGAGAVAIGDPNVATGVGAVAIGEDNTATGQGAVALGATSSALGEGAVALGDASSSAGTGAFAGGETSVANGQGAVALGNASSANGDGAVALGDASNAVGPSSIAIGEGAKALASNSIALGGGAQTIGANSVALGVDAKAANNNDVALGANSVTAAPHVGAFDITGGATAGSSDTNGVVSVGAAGAERQIQNVAAGVLSATSTDAVNGSQLYSVASDVNKTGQSVASALGGGSSYVPGAGVSAPSYSVGGKTYNDVGSALSATNKLAVEYTPDASGNATPVINLVSSALPAGTTGVAVTGVAPGAVNATSEDAVNGAQLYAAEQNTIKYDSSAKTSLTFNPGGSPTVLHNVGAGVAPTDAVNMGQLSDLSSSIDGRFNQDEAQINKAKRMAAGAGAVGLAAAAMHFDDRVGSVSLGAAAGMFDSMYGVAAGLNYTATTNWRVTGNVAFVPQTRDIGGAVAAVYTLW
jgi:hypothetical protein